ncbi:hypothetical protein ZIOFF_034872 [Zingiber officinale]|uniref:Ribophorin II n=1 Tax=Zingiber officinale TaxID=94328 RepID=A0A8J5L293_ZINOF|nr:hypothetical protein ZIOFF_034872 [Zingiber officinale]
MASRLHEGKRSDPLRHVVQRMAPNHGSMGLRSLICALLSICAAASIRPISDAHRSAALDLFVPSGGLFQSLEETYEALRTFQILGVGNFSDIGPATCPVIIDNLTSPASSPKDLFDAIRVNSILECQIGSQTFKDVAEKFQDLIKSTDKLMNFYYSILGLLHVKAQGVSVVLPDAEGVFYSIKALSQNDGRWQYDSNNAESSTCAAGIALEALAGVVSLADIELVQSKSRDRAEGWADGAGPRFCGPLVRRFCATENGRGSSPARDQVEAQRNRTQRREKDSGSCSILGREPQRGGRRDQGRSNEDMVETRRSSASTKQQAKLGTVAGGLSLLENLRGRKRRPVAEGTAVTQTLAAREEMSRTKRREEGGGPTKRDRGAGTDLETVEKREGDDGTWRQAASIGIQSESRGNRNSARESAVNLEFDASSQKKFEIGTIKHDIVKLFDSIKSYDDGTLYFEEKHIDGSEYKGPLATTASVVRGASAFAAIVSEKLNIPGDKLVGIAKFLLSVGVPGSTKDLFNQIDSLSHIENNRISIPLILSLPSTVLSLTSKDQLKVEVTTVFGSAAPPLTVNLVRASSSDVKNNPILENQELQFDTEKNVHYLDILPLKIDIGKYTLEFEISLHDPENLNTYATGGHAHSLIFLTGLVKVDKSQIGIYDTDSESSASMLKLDFFKDDKISLVANHLQKLRLSFQLFTPLGNTIKPHQAFLKLRHESKVEHIFALENSSRQYKIILDFLALVEKFYYLSGRYDIELAVGDAAMENSFLYVLGYIDLDLPEPPERASRPPSLSVDPYARFGPKQEISHIFRAPETRPPKELSLAFLAFTLVPLGGFVIGARVLVDGFHFDAQTKATFISHCFLSMSILVSVQLLTLGVNLKSFPSSSVHALFSLLFHAGIAAILLLYVLFWLKLDLFTTLKVLGLIGVFLIFVGHRTLSCLASTSAGKVKTN